MMEWVEFLVTAIVCSICGFWVGYRYGSKIANEALTDLTNAYQELQKRVRG